MKMWRIAWEREPQGDNAVWLSSQTCLMILTKRNTFTDWQMEIDGKVYGREKVMSRVIFFLY